MRREILRLFCGIVHFFQVSITIYTVDADGVWLAAQIWASYQFVKVRERMVHA